MIDIETIVVLCMYSLATCTFVILELVEKGAALKLHFDLNLPEDIIIT